MLCIKTPVLTHLFNHPLPFFALFRFPDNSLLSCTVTMGTEVSEPGMCRLQCRWQNSKRDMAATQWAFIQHFIFLWVKGNTAHTSIYMTPPPTPPSPSPVPSHTAVSDCRRRRLNGVIIFMINKTFLHIALSSAFGRSSCWRQLPLSSSASPPPPVIFRLHVKNLTSCPIWHMASVLSKNDKKRQVHWLAREESF